LAVGEEEEGEKGRQFFFVSPRSAPHPRKTGEKGEEIKGVWSRMPVSSRRFGGKGRQSAKKEYRGVVEDYVPVGTEGKGERGKPVSVVPRSPCHGENRERGKGRDHRCSVYAVNVCWSTAGKGKKDPWHVASLVDGLPSKGKKGVHD